MSLASYYKINAVEQSVDCDWGPCTIYHVDGGELGSIEIGVYPETNRVSIIEETPHEYTRNE